MKIAVIGAGIAGLTIAQACKKQGADVQVFEKSRSVGGRLANKRLDWATVDIGAQYFTARDPRFRLQVQQWLKQKIVKHWRFSPHVIKDGKLQKSPDETIRYIGVPNMNAIAHDLAAGLNLHLSTRVIGVTKNNTSEQWQIQTEGEQLHDGFDWLVMALPAEQSKQLLNNPAYSDEIKDQLLGPCWALALATSGKVTIPVQGIFGDETVSWSTRLNSRVKFTGQRYDDLWMLHFSQQWSAANGKHTDVDIPAVGVAWLSQILQTPLTAVHSYQHYWRYAKPYENTAQNNTLVNIQQGLAVIGDWANGGRVEGAYISAINAFEKMFPNIENCIN